MKNGLEFEHIHKIAQTPELNGHLVVGRSPVRFVSHTEVKSTRKITEILKRSIEAGIFPPELRGQNTLLDHDFQRNGHSRVGTGLIHQIGDAAFVTFSLPEQRRHFVHAGVVALKDNGKHDFVGAQRIQSLDSFHVITGMCLFGGSAVKAIDEQGGSWALTNPYISPEPAGQIQDIQIDKRIQPYEADSLLKLTGFIGTLDRTKDPAVLLAIPRLEYWNYGMELYDQGLMKREVALKWFGEVDERAARVEQAFRKRLPQEFNTQVLSPLAPIEQPLRDAVVEERVGVLPELIQALEAEDPIWKAVLDLVRVADMSLEDQSKKRFPQTFQDLNNLSYVIGYLKGIEKSPLLVAVENTEEMNILRNTLPFIGAVREDAVIAAFYLHSNVVLKEDPPDDSRRFLYFYSPNGQHAAAVQEIVVANKDPLSVQ